MTDAQTPLISLLENASGLDAAQLRASLAVPPDPKMGDYALPCFPLAKVLRKNPAQIASEIAAALEPGDVVASAKAAGPYVNITLNRQPFVEAVLGQIVREGDSFGAGEAAGQKLVIEFSSPNMAKPFHVGHLSSTIIGGSLAHLFSFTGNDVVRVNHIGDWGTPVGAQIAAFRRWGDETELESNPISHMVELYQRYHREKGDDPSLEADAREWFRRLETGDPEAREFWQRIRDLSRQALEATYARLQVHFDHYQGEAFYEDMLEDTVAEARSRGITELSDGALIIPLSEKDIETPLLLLKSDGATTYATRDMAAAIYRAREYAFDTSVYVVARDQELHFQQLFAALELMGFDWAERMVHVKFGHVHGMSTRKGGAILLQELLDRAGDKVREVIRENQAEMFSELGEDQVDDVAEAVGVGAIIFGTLNRKRNKDSEFSWDTALQFTGETGPYVQYAHARLCSILRKAGRPLPEKADLSLLSHDAEWALVKVLARFPADVAAACRSYEPSIVARSLLDMSQTLTRFYDQCRVLGDDQALTDARLTLVDRVRQVIRTGLGLLCMEAPEQM